MIVNDYCEKEMESLSLSRPEKIAFGLLVFTKYKRDFTPFVSSSGALIVQEEELASIKNSDVKELQELDWKQQTQYHWEFKL